MAEYRKAPSGHDSWGTVVYTRELTEEEIRNYELEYAPEET